jgi:hypothetical protein
MTFFDLELRTVASLHPDGEPDEFISTLTGSIVASGEHDVRRRAGKGRQRRPQEKCNVSKSQNASGSCGNGWLGGPRCH